MRDIICTLTPHLLPPMFHTTLDAVKTKHNTGNEARVFILHNAHKESFKVNF